MHICMWSSRLLQLRTQLPGPAFGSAICKEVYEGGTKENLKNERVPASAGICPYLGRVVKKLRFKICNMHGKPPRPVSIAGYIAQDE